MKSKNRRFITIFLVFITALMFQSVSGQKTVRTVESVEIQGNSNLTDEQILRFVKVRPGFVFDEEKMDEDLNALRSLENLDDRYVKISPEQTATGNVRLIIQVREQPVIKELDIKGLKYVSKGEILGIMNTEKLAIGTAYNYKNARSAYTPIKEFLAERGFPDAKVTIFEEQLTPNTVKVGFLIEEKPEKNTNRKTVNENQPE